VQRIPRARFIGMHRCAASDEFAFRSLDGPALLQVMHAHGNRENLVYWVEFKNDDEFPGQMFGSIAGGSAHKFGLFRRRETDQWVQGLDLSDAVRRCDAGELPGCPLIDSLSAVTD
jgi:hypothetical protein